jgi:hypothetical protein
MYERWARGPHRGLGGEVAHAPDVDIEVDDAHVALWDADGQRPPFDESPGAVRRPRRFAFSNARRRAAWWITEAPLLAHELVDSAMSEFRVVERATAR